MVALLIHGKRKIAAEFNCRLICVNSGSPVRIRPSAPDFEYKIGPGERSECLRKQPVPPKVPPISKEPLRFVAPPALMGRFVQVARMKGRGHHVRRWADASRRAAECDPPERPRPSFRDHPPRWDPRRFGSRAPRPVGGIVRGARPRPVRVGSA